MDLQLEHRTAFNSNSIIFVLGIGKQEQLQDYQVGTITLMFLFNKFNIRFGIYKWSRTGSSTTDYFQHGLGVTPKIALKIN